MNGQIPPESEPRARASGPDAPPDASSEGGTATPGYGGYGSGYGGYGYGSGSLLGDSERSFVHYLQVIYRRRYLAASVFAAVFLGVLLYTITAPRIYQASTRILIEREDPNVVSFQEVLDQNTLTDDYYETQYAILSGRGLARRTIDALDLWSHPTFNPPARLTLRGVVMAPVNLLASAFQSGAPVDSPETAETGTQSRVIDQFLNRLDVEAVRYSRLVDVRFNSPDPGLAARVANEVATQYIGQTLEFRSSTTKEASAFIATQLAEQRQKLEGSERALQAYRERTGSVELAERQNVVVQRLADLNAALTRAGTMRIQKEAAYNQVRNFEQNPAPIDTMPSVLSNVFIQQQKTELAQLQRQRAQLSEKLGPNHPDMVKIGLAITNAEMKIHAEVGQLVQAMRNDYEAALAEERSLASALNAQKAEAEGLNRAGIQHGVLQRDAEANRQLFDALLKRGQETGVSEELTSGNIRVIDHAEVPRAPISPNTFNNLLIALLGGLTLAIGLAFASEYIDDRVKNPDEMKQYLGLPFLGMVPALFGQRGYVTPLISEGVSSMFSESFRSIRTNVLFSSTDSGGRMVVVTSSAPGEGKTVVSTNLSIALAQAGHRVLLIDADMRKPRVHQVFSAELAPGLSNLLVSSVPASDAIRESSTPGLWLMPAGTTPPNPAELLGSRRFKDFTAFLLQHFDWVIVDTPPVMAVTDAAIAAHLAHGVLFVVGSEMTSRRVAQRAVEQLELGQAKFLGAVLNRVDLDHNAYYYSRYYRAEYGGYYGPPGSGAQGVPGSSSGDVPVLTSEGHIGKNRVARIATSVTTGMRAAAARAAASLRVERPL